MTHGCLVEPLTDFGPSVAAADTMEDVDYPFVDYGKRRQYCLDHEIWRKCGMTASRFLNGMRINTGVDDMMM